MDSVAKRSIQHAFSAYVILVLYKETLRANAIFQLFTTKDFYVRWWLYLHAFLKVLSFCCCCGGW